MARQSEACGRCGVNPAKGYATIGDVRYCHGDHDEEPTCYMRSSWDETNGWMKHVVIQDRTTTSYWVQRLSESGDTSPGSA